MQEDLNQFKGSIAWELVPKALSNQVIGTRWVFRNKLDEDGIFLKTKVIILQQDTINIKT